MGKLIRENSFFFIGFLCFIIFGGILLLNIEQLDAIKYFGENRTDLLNMFFIYWTKLGEEYIYILALLIFLFVKTRYSIFIPLTGLAVVIVSFLTKSFFAHDRPLLWMTKMNLVDQVNFVEGIHILNGPNSFPSGHAMSAFALYSIIAFFSPYKKITGTVFFVIALLIAISRVYLVQHFFQDIYLGSILGVLIAMMMFQLQKRVGNSYSPTHWINEPFFGKKENNLA